MTQLILSAKQFDIIKTISFFINFERNFNLFDYKESLILINTTKNRIETLKRIHENIRKMQIKSINYQNKKKKNAFLLKERNKIFLLTKNFKRKNKSKKLKSIKIEIFLIKK